MKPLKNPKITRNVFTVLAAFMFGVTIVLVLIAISTDTTSAATYWDGAINLFKAMTSGAITVGLGVIAGKAQSRIEEEVEHDYLRVTK